MVAAVVPPTYGNVYKCEVCGGEITVTKNFHLSEDDELPVFRCHGHEMVKKG
jgi:hypothetical protein